MKKLILILIVLLPAIGYSTAQQPDIIIINKDTLMLFSNPLEQYPHVQELRPKFFADWNSSISTGCWRGYIAEWTISNNKLYLTNIYSCDFSNHNIKANLNMLFKGDVNKGKVEATWVTGNLWMPRGKLIHYIHSGYMSVYEKETKITVAKGKVISIKNYDYPNAKETVFANHDDSLKKFIYSNINWAKLPVLKDKTIRVVVAFQTGETSHPDSIKILRRSEEYPILNEEAKRVVGLLTWGVYYKFGKVYQVEWGIPFLFNEENRKEYYH